MRIPSSKFQDWKAAEAELADIERAFRDLSADLSPTDRVRVTQRLAALKAARLRVLQMFQAVEEERALQKESASEFDRLSESDGPEPTRSRREGPPRPDAEDWLW